MTSELFVAIKAGDVAGVERLLTSDRGLVDERDADGLSTLLTHAQSWTAKLDDTVRFYQTTDVGAAIVGWLASWWMGVFIGVPFETTTHVRQAQSPSLL